MDEYSMKKIQLLAEYHPFDVKTVSWVFERCERSFDDTEKVLEFASEFNSFDYAIRIVMEGSNE